MIAPCVLSHVSSLRSSAGSVVLVTPSRLLSPRRSTMIARGTTPQAWLMHVCPCAATHESQASAALPHASSAVPGWQASFASQQPVQLAGVQVGAAGWEEQPAAARAAATISALTSDEMEG